MKHHSYFNLLLTLNLITIIFLFSRFSLTGYWADVIAASIIGAITILSIKRFKDLRKSILLLFAAGHALLYLRLFISFILLTSFGKYPLNVPVEKSTQGLFVEHEYFIPTGAYGCGYGTVWRTESFKYIPFFEYEVYSDNCSDRDYENFSETEK